MASGRERRAETARVAEGGARAERGARRAERRARKARRDENLVLFGVKKHGKTTTEDGQVLIRDHQMGSLRHHQTGRTGSKNGRRGAFPGPPPSTSLLLDFNNQMPKSGRRGACENRLR